MNRSHLRMGGTGGGKQDYWNFQQGRRGQRPRSQGMGSSEDHSKSEHMGLVDGFVEEQSGFMVN